MLRIALSQLNFIVGDLEGNALKMQAQMQRAKADGVDLIVFSELSICGYTPKDKLNYSSFIRRCNETVENLATFTDSSFGVIVGAPRFTKRDKGKLLFNSAILLHNGKVASEVNKSLLPTYDVFDEFRYFEPAANLNVVEFKGYKLAITICEDLWNLDEPYLYSASPMDTLIKQSPDIMINLSGSPYSYNHVEERKSRMVENAKLYKLPLVYVNQVGGNTEILFDGGSMFINRDGEIAEELAYFEEDYRIVEWERSKTYKDNSTDFRNKDIKLIHQALVMGIKDYFSKMGFKKALLGSSGGIDSALIHALAVEALGGENVKAVMLPSKYSSEGSVKDAVKLAKNLSSPYEIISIEGMVTAAESALQPIFEGHPNDVTEENIQARNRGVLLMAISNKFGSILLNTSNKSETAVGYSTLYGDMCGGFSAIGDLYKTQVYALSNYMNRNGEIIPQEIIDKAPSAELRPNQKDSDSLPPYDLLDTILMHYIEQQLSWKEIVRLGFDENIVRKIVKLVDRTEYKRFQAPPILRISHRAFGLGRQMPLVAKFWN